MERYTQNPVIASLGDKYTWEMTPEELEEVEKLYYQRHIENRLRDLVSKVREVQDAMFDYRFNDLDTKSLLDRDGSYYDSLVKAELQTREQIDSLLKENETLSLGSKNTIHKQYGVTRSFLNQHGLEQVKASKPGYKNRTNKRNRN